MSDKFDKAEAAIGYTFADKEILRCALTHKSYTNEHGGVCNGRLEYLGDGILDMLVAEYLYRANPAAEEGRLTEMRQQIVSREPLAAAVRDMRLFAYYRLGKGAKRTAAEFEAKAVSDVFEAVTAAIYLDGGLDAARAFVYAHLISRSPYAQKG